MSLKPDLSDIRLSHAMLRDDRVGMLSDAGFRSLFQIVRYCAAKLVWTYDPPSDGSMPDEDERLRRICGNLSARQWRKVRPELEQFFVIRDGRWHLNEPWIEVITGSGRVAIPLSIRDDIAKREGQRCTYCGATGVALEYDHIFPVAQGGTNAPSNLTLACEGCNRSKGARTLREWINGR